MRKSLLALLILLGLFACTGGECFLVDGNGIDFDIDDDDFDEDDFDDLF